MKFSEFLRKRIDDETKHDISVFLGCPLCEVSTAGFLAYILYNSVQQDKKIKKIEMLIESLESIIQEIRLKNNEREK